VVLDSLLKCSLAQQKYLFMSACLAEHIFLSTVYSSYISFHPYLIFRCIHHQRFLMQYVISQICSFNWMCIVICYFTCLLFENFHILAIKTDMALHLGELYSMTIYHTSLLYHFRFGVRWYIAPTTLQASWS